ncbi:FAD-dependent oxidoreductase [Halodesulfurarchaeum formicicum]|uniref:Amine oxidase domain-containing protein n=1 Tax=Halodesulfurarchaeum formicicum TaxID=1873524 RepID=A0A1J1A9W4_9EURY|nr:FAD-dependent oxidoreductase [Halodesulfurarchaeum formicicum]APE94924.1 hypothetical protein HSR6_0459 [Halodesulfurarchaeum formicicum]
MSVAVIGAGIAGIASAHTLQADGLEVSLFEKRDFSDGDVPDQPRFIAASDDAVLDLASGLGVEDAVRPVPLERMGAFQDGEITTFDQMEIFLKPRQDLSLFEKIMRVVFAPVVGLDRASVREFHSALADHQFDPLDRDLYNERLHEQSIQEWMAQFDDGLQELLIKPTLRAMTYDDDFEHTSADRSVAALKKVVRMVQDGASVLPNGQRPFYEALGEELPAENLRTGTEVTAITAETDSVLVEFRDDGTTTEASFDAAVLATPIDRSAELLEADFDFEYNQTRGVVLDGTLTEDLALLIGGDEAYNLRSVVAVGETHNAFVRDMNTDIDVEAVYDGEPTRRAAETVTTTPHIEPGKSIPEIQYDDRVFLAGDFRYYPSFDTAARTGRAAAAKVREQLRGR